MFSDERFARKKIVKFKKISAKWVRRERKKILFESGQMEKAR
jgi:hypothetical protein